MPDTKIRITISAAAKGLRSTFSRSGKALKAFRGEMGRTKEAAVSLNGTLKMALGGLGMKMVATSLFEAGVRAQALDVSFRSISGSAAKAADELNFIRKVSRRLGQEFYSTADSYKGIFAAAKGTEMEGKGVRDLFVSMTEAGTALHASNDALQRAFVQLGQGISKSRFQLQDLKAISEALPGVGMHQFAEALGVTTAEFLKMVSTGKVVASDFLPKLSKSLHKEFGEAALEASNTAQAALNRFKTSWMDIKVVISNSGFLSEAESSLRGLAAAFRDPATKKAIRQYAHDFFAMLKAMGSFIAQNREVLLTLAATGLILPRLIKLWNGLNAATLVLSGVSFIPWLAQINEGLSGIVTTTLTLPGALFSAASGMTALYAGYKAGEWLAMRKSLQGIADATAGLNRYTARTADKFREISTATGVTVISMADLDQAIKINKIHYDDLTGTWKAGAKDQAAAVTKSAATQVQVTGKALTAMKRKYKQYAAEIKRLQNEIAGRELSLAAQLRAMARTGMSDLGAWRDRRKEAEEYYQAAQKAAAAGNFKKAVKLADQAKTAYADLNKEVKTGSKVQISSAVALKLSMAGVKKAGNLAIDALKKQKAAAEAAAKALDKKAGGKLSGKIKDQLATVDKLMQGTSVKWGKVWQAMNQAAAAKTKAGMQKVDREIKAIVLKNRTIYIDVVKREHHRLGGRVGFRAGGRLPGYGGGDRIPALLEAGEYIMRKEAVNKFGAGIFQALNNLRLPDLPKFAAGGQVGEAGAGEDGATITINFAFPSGATVGPFRGTRSLIRDLDRERQNMALGTSA